MGAAFTREQIDKRTIDACRMAKARDKRNKALRQSTLPAHWPTLVVFGLSIHPPPKVNPHNQPITSTVVAGVRIPTSGSA